MIGKLIPMKIHLFSNNWSLLASVMVLPNNIWDIGNEYGKIYFYALIGIKWILTETEKKGSISPAGFPIQQRI